MRRYQCLFIKVQAVFPHTMRKLCIFSLLVLISTIHALSLSLTRKTGQSLTDFSRRDNNGSTPIINDNDRFYNVNISLGGAVFTVELDTGRYGYRACPVDSNVDHRSSDLWVFGDVPYTKDVSVQRMHIEYAGGTVSGKNIHLLHFNASSHFSRVN